MLLQIRDYIQQKQVVSTQQLAREFRLDEQALQPMLKVWISKGVIRPCEEKSTCQSSCFRCTIKTPVFYQYITTS